MLHSLYSARALTVLSVLSILALSHAAVSNQTLARNGDGPFKYYRITALTSLGDGTVLASFDGRPDGADAPSPNSILQRRSTDNGETWGDLTYIAKGQPGSGGVQKYGFSDPSYVVDSGKGTVFNLHVFSKDQGFPNSVLGNNDTDVDVLSAEVSLSTDGGLSWSTDPDNQPNLPPVASDKDGAPPLITTAIKPVGATVDGVDNVGGVLGAFATSGQGIQLKYGKYAGRLVVPFVGRVIQSDGSTAAQAYSVYSDDSGGTWQMGTPVGTGMDENKVVELSNGTVMLNSRPGDGSGYRKVALSNDGGITYSDLRTETQLPDPGCNGAITRMHPNAEQGSDLARILLFTNANNQESRVNGTVRYSCDDGNTWSAGKVFSPGATAYSTITALESDKFGIFYEGLDNELVLLQVDVDWLEVSC
ncbi:hypothetical protein ASPVEDRAFT_156144 [Aspergillus versicolor CBS 583.65]|uniref:Sialidase domain-containing protein n=1 Tax=Aspergillus versicolor CBS 583.65 TaxID=1036611 RepID=A0A1L9Q400_ASPVE|nr:uncharacterized protein ASPVEDRAFT_156144 [Aspergillus versicolor CBS 583.65]OJJ08505.1 hypothetical protein ASPVEDRAFT_156144 [Aspergillus versicolor CBS 583.65]